MLLCQVMVEADSQDESKGKRRDDAMNCESGKVCNSERRDQKRNVAGIKKF